MVATCKRVQRLRIEVAMSGSELDSGKRRRLIAVGVICVGVSLGLPLFLCLRELALDKQRDALPAR